MKRSILSFLLLAVFLTACAQPTPEPTPAIPPTLTLLPSLTPTFTLTPTPLPSPTPLPTSTWTPMPTLSPDEAQNFVLQLLETNGGCELPCWWGVIPGITEWRETVSFFNIFGSITISRYLNEDTKSDFLRFNFNPPKFYMIINYSGTGDLIEKIRVHTEMLDDIKEEYDFDNPEYYAIMHNYTLDNILSRYGEPSQVFIKSFSPSPAYFNTQTLLYYPDIGVIMEYESESFYTARDGIEYTITCPAEGFIKLLLFDPSEEMSLEKLLAPIEDFSRFMELEEATGMTVEEFTKIYKTPGCHTYLLTPIELWPSEYSG